MKETVEHNNRFYKQSNGEILTESEQLKEWLIVANKEIERLNNIINEFNKLIENEINESKLEEDYDRVDAMEYCLATLRELKGSDKE